MICTTLFIMLIVFMNCQVVLYCELGNCLFSSPLIKHGPSVSSAKGGSKRSFNASFTQYFDTSRSPLSVGNFCDFYNHCYRRLKGMKITNKDIRDLLLSVRWVHSGTLAASPQVIRPLNWTSIIYFSNYHLSRKFYNQLYGQLYQQPIQEIFYPVLVSSIIIFHFTLHCTICFFDMKKYSNIYYAAC